MSSAVHRIGRDDERADVIRAIRKRIATAKGLATSGLLTRLEEARLVRWFTTLVSDIEAGAHERPE